MNIVVVTPPPVQPVTLEEVYDHLRLVPEGSPATHPQDDMLERHIKAATGEAESITHRAFVQQTIRLYMDHFPYPGTWFSGERWWSDIYGPGYIALLRPPFSQVVNVTYFDGANESKTVDADNYFVTNDQVPRLYFGSSFSVPTYYARNDAWAVEYEVGYPPEGSPPEDYRANIPAEIKEAILLGVELLYRSHDVKNRETLENARASLLSDFVVHTIV